MKKQLLYFALLYTAFSFAQVGINTTTPDASSMLDISATDKGVLVPRISLANVTTTMLDGTNTAATGLLIWNTNATTVGGNGVGFYFFNGTQWIPITPTPSTDDQNLTTPTLVGTTLNLGIENGIGTSINLAALQDGTGTDDQNIQNLTFNSTTNVLTVGIENGTSQTVNLSTLQDGTGTDDQTIDNFSLNGTILRLSLENDGQPLQTVNLAPLVGTDDQNLTTPTLTGTTLNLGIENGSGTSVNLATLKDHDWYEEGTTTSPDAITDDMFTQGNVGIGTTTVNYPLQVETATNSRTVSLTNSSNGTTAYGLYNQINESSAPSSSGSTTGIVNSITRTNQGKISGLSNGFPSSNATSSYGYLYGVENSFGTATANITVGFLNRFQGTTIEATGTKNLLSGTFTDFFGIQSYNISSGLSGNFYGLHNLTICSSRRWKYIVVCCCCSDGNLSKKISSKTICFSNIRINTIMSSTSS